MILEIRHVFNLAAKDCAVKEERIPGVKLEHYANFVGISRHLAVIIHKFNILLFLSATHLFAFRN